MRPTKKKTQLLIFFLLLCGVSGCLPQDISDYHLNQLNFPTQVSTQIQNFEELSNSYSISDVSEELCFRVPQYVGDALSADDPEVCYPFCFINRDTHELICTIRDPHWRLENNQPFRLRLSAERQVSYSPSMTIQQLVDLVEEEEPQKKVDKTLDKSPPTDPPADPPPSDPPPPAGLSCDVACEVGYFCNPDTGQCEVTPDENLCADITCDTDQYCDGETGACVDYEEDPPADGPGSPGTRDDRSDNNDSQGSENPLACAYNPASCGDAKGWCSLNPEAGFNPLVFAVLILPFLGLAIRRIVLQNSHD